MRAVQLIKQYTMLATLTLVVASGCQSEDDDLLQVDSTGSTSVNQQALASLLAELPLEALSDDEISGLYYMREEEKLAHDVYTVLYVTWSQNVFDNIASSEQTHTDSVLALINRYSLSDPAAGNAIGEFADTSLQALYDSLVAQGSSSLIDALLVGAAIEEIDIIDIQEQLDNTVDNEDISIVYGNLIKGSRNHLRAFVNVLAKQGVEYSPQYLSQSVYDAIINSPTETK